MRIELLHPVYWPEVRRGSERFIHDLAAGLIARGHSPELITSHRGGLSRSVEDGLPIVRLPRPPQGRLVRRRYEDYLTHVPLSYAALRLARGVEVAHALYPADALAAARWGERTGRPTVLSHMGIPFREGLNQRRLRLEVLIRALDGVDVTVGLSNAVRDAFHRELGREVRVIYPGVDTTVFTPGGERAAAPTIFCGAAIDQYRKRVPLLIAAFARVRRERPDARLVLNDPHDPKVVAQVGADTEGIELRDVDDRDALVDAYREAWVSALPSFAEAFGLVLVEAMACGTPVVATDGFAFGEIVDRGTVGRLFDDTGPEPEKDLAPALLEALELATDAATGAACRDRAQDFSNETCADAYAALYSELIRA